MSQNALLWDDRELGSHALQRTSPLDLPVRPARAVGLVAGVGAAVVHAALVWVALSVGSLHSPEPQPVAAAVSDWIEVLPEPPKPEAAPKVEPEPPAAPEPARAAPKTRAPKALPRQAPAPAAASARAAAVVTQQPDPAVVDFGNTFVQGNAAQYAGGVTASAGAADHAVHDANARADGIEGGTATGAASDRSHDPMLADGARWDLPFPEEADAEGLDAALVELRVRVAADGAVEQVDVVKDPGFGFGRDARRYALRKRWVAGKNKLGQPIASAVSVAVRFRR
jgi:outer membrane biosynthesis protein TonB